MTKLSLGTSQFMYANMIVLYFGKNTQIKCVSVCGVSRWVDNNSNGKKVTHKVLCYFPLTHCLKRLCGCRLTAKEMRWHYTDRPNKEDVLHHLADEKIWKSATTLVSRNKRNRNLVPQGSKNNSVARTCMLNTKVTYF